MSKDKVEIISLSDIILPPGILKKVPLELIGKYHFIPIGLKDNILTVVFGEMPDEKIIEEIKAAVKHEVRFVLASKRGVRRCAKALVKGKDIPYKPSSIGVSNTILQATRSQFTKYRKLISDLSSTKRRLNYVIIGGLAVFIVFIVISLIPRSSPYSNYPPPQPGQPTYIDQAPSKTPFGKFSFIKSSVEEFSKRSITKDAQSIYEQYNKAVVIIYIYEKDGSPLAQGSGFIVRDDGVIATNFHVIKGAHSVKIRLPKEAKLPNPKVEGVVFADKKNDLVLLKVKGKNLPTVKVGDSDILKHGEKVFVISSPLRALLSSSDDIDTMNTITEGLVSNRAKGKIQISAQISPGSSGGPVFNSKGEVIGVATMVISHHLDAQNINFAMPINIVKEKIPQKKYIPIDKFLRENYIVSADTWYHRGYDKLLLGHYQDAIEDFKKAIDIDPKYMYAYLNIGVIYYNLGEYRKSIAYYKKALELAPEHADIYYNLSLSYYKLGDTDNAFKQYRRLKRLDKESARELFEVISK